MKGKGNRKQSTPFNSFNQATEVITLKFEEQVIQPMKEGAMQPISNTREAIDYMLASGAWSESDLREWVLPQLAMTPCFAGSIIAVAKERQNPKPEIDYSEEAKAGLEQKIAENDRKLAEHNRRILYFTRMLKHCYATARPVLSTARQGHCRASASRTRTTGSNAKKATSGSGGSDPEPEPRRQPRLSGLFALRNILTACRTLIAANTYRSEVLA